MTIASIPIERGNQVISITFRNGHKLEAAVIRGHAHASEDGQHIMLVLDIDDEIADVLRRTMLRMKSKNPADEAADAA